jgi:fibronectin-binding autotransporter adhesin
MVTGMAKSLCTLNFLRRKTGFFLAASALAGLLAIHPALAATNEWTSTSSVNWFLPGNWSGGVPTSGDDVLFANPSNVVSIIQGPSTATADNIFLDAGRLTVGSLDPGTLVVDGGIAIGTAGNNATLTFNFGTISLNSLSVGANGTYTDTSFGNLVLTGSDPTIKMAAGVNVVINSSVSGTSGLIKDGLGTLTLAGNNTYSGGTVITIGTLQIGNGGTTGNLGAGDVVNNGQLVFNRSNTLIVSNFISGTGSLSQNGSGTTVLVADNTYSGGTTIGAGTLQIGNGGTTGSLGSGDIVDNGTLAFNRSDTVTLDNEISGTGNLRQSGTGTLVLTGSNSYSGTTTISAGTLQVGDGGTAGSLGTGAITDNGTLVFNRSDELTIAGGISGTGRVEQVGTGTTILTGNSSYSGSTLISAGTLQVGSGGTSGSLGTGAVSNDSVLAFNRSDTLTVANNITGTGSLIQSGSGTTILTGTNKYDGTTTISSGALQVGNGGTTGTLGTGDVDNAGSLIFNRSDSVTVSNLITGAGSLTKSGSGTLTIVADNAYSGGTTINGGTLQVGDGGTTGSIGSGDITNSATVVFNRTNDLTVAGDISGSGTLIQSGAGTLVLTGSNSYSGSTIIRSGTLQVGDGGTNGLLGTGTVSNNSALVFNRSDDLTVSNLIIGAGSLTQLGGGTLTLTANSTYGGGTVISNGALQVGNGGTTGSIGTGEVFNAGSLIFNRTNSLTVANVITGTGSLTHTGAGTLTLTGTNTYSGGTWVENTGTLAIKNSHALGSGDLNLLTGTLRADPMVIYVGGNYVQGSNATFQVAIAGTGTLAGTGTNEFDQLNIAGTASLDGTLHVVGSGGYQPKPNDSVAVVVASNGVSGTFSTFTNDIAHSVLLEPQLRYNVNDVTLIWEQQSFVPYAMTRNQRAVARGLDSIAGSTNERDVDLLNFLDYLPSLTNQLPGALDLIGPEELTAMFTLSRVGAESEGRRFLNRVSFLGAGYLEQYDKLTAIANRRKPQQPTLSDPATIPWGIYMDGVVESVDVSGDSNAKGYNINGNGISIGADAWANDNVVMGLSGTYAPASADLAHGGSVDSDSIRGQVYAAWFRQGLHVEGMVGGGMDSYDTSRVSIDGKATGSTDGTVWYALLGAGYEWQQGNWSFGPQAAVQYTSVSIDSFTEHGSMAPLSIASQSEDALYAQVGARLRYRGYVTGTWTFVTPELFMAWRHDFMNNTVGLKSEFASGAGSPFTVQGPAMGSDSFVGGLGLTVHWTKVVSTYLHYITQLGQGAYDAHGVDGGLRLDF